MTYDEYLETLSVSERSVVEEAMRLHCQEAMRERIKLLKTLERCRDLHEIALPKFNWGASFLDAEAIALLNEVPAEVKEALK